MDKQIVYRIYCGKRIGKSDVKVLHTDFIRFIYDVVVPIFDGFTLFDVNGYWDDTREPTTIIEIIVTNYHHRDYQHIQRIAKRYKETFKQEAVLVTQQPIECELV